MSVASLITVQDPNFAFDHDQMHRRMMDNLPAGFQSSAAVFLLDPIIAASVPAGDWNFNHSQAHYDFAAANPTIYWPSIVSIADIDIEDGPTAWWSFANEQLHKIANSVEPTV